MTAGNAAAHAPTQRDGDRDQALERSAGQDIGSATGGGGLAVAVLGLQRTAGNAAVVQLLRRYGSPAAPAAAPPQPAEREEAAPPLQPAPAPSDLLGDVPALAEGQSPTKTQRAEKRAEGEAMSLSEEQVAIGGGGQPVAGFGTPSGAPPLAGAFVDRGRRNTIAFGEAEEQGLDREGGDVDPGTEDLRPRVFIAGGRTGKAAWGGGAGAGPHGNQESGSAELVSPEIETSWGGAFANADAWVKDGTGTVTVKRDYVSSDAGDQGNGWYVTDKAAAGLDRHERLHVAKSRDLYADKMQPLLDRILMSYQYGKGKVYKSVDAAQLVRQYVDWPASVKSFDEDDKAWNGKGGQVDQEDQFSPNFPRQIGPGKVNGKAFTNRLKMPTEEAPPE
jgi:hypothetical protein